MPSFIAKAAILFETYRGTFCAPPPTPRLRNSEKAQPCEVQQKVVYCKGWRHWWIRPRDLTVWISWCKVKEEMQTNFMWPAKENVLQVKWEDMLCVSEPPVQTSKTQKYSFLLPRLFGCVDVNKPNNILVSIVFNTVQTVDGNFGSDPELSGAVYVNLSTTCRYVRQNSKMTLTLVTLPTRSLHGWATRW